MRYNYLELKWQEFPIEQHVLRLTCKQVQQKEVAISYKVSGKKLWLHDVYL